MNNETRILIVEDLTTDYELAQREIRKVIEQSNFERAEKQGDFLKALEEFRPDLILSDYKLPDFDGLKVLKLAQKLLPSIPVIIWTGEMGESVAVDCLKQGAVNYVLKDDMKRLGPAVIRALEERNLLLEKKQVEEKYQTIFENAAEGIFQVTPNGRLMNVNPAMARIYGYSSPAEMIDTVTDIHTQMYVDKWSRDQFIQLLQQDGRVKNFEVRNFRKDGSIIWISTSTRVVRDEDGCIVYHEGFLQDITEHKQIEEAEREQRLLTEALRHTAESLSSTLDYGEVLDQILTMVGSVVPSDAATIMLIDGAKARVVRSQGYLERGLNTEVMELELLLPDTANLRQMLETGKPVIVPDTDSFSDWRRSPANEWVRSNVGAPILLYGDVIGFILLDGAISGFFTPLHAEHLVAFSNQAALAIHNSRLLQQAQEEIAARKRTEEALRESEERFRLIAQNAEDLIWTMNMDFQITYVSPAVERMLGYSAQEILTSSPAQFLTSNSFELGLKTFQEEVANASLQPNPNYARALEMEYRRKDGSVLWVETKFSFFRDPNGYPVTVLGVGRDITERKQAEAHSKDLLDFNEKILNHSPLGIITYKLTGECVFANENAAVILGTGIEQLKSQNFHSIQSWKVSGLYDLANLAIATHSLMTADVHHESTFGKELWLRSYFIPFRSKDEDHLLLTISDITDRRQTEDKLRESENRLILALSAAQMSVWEWDLQTNRVLWSPEIYEITDISESTFDGTIDGILDLIHPQDAARISEAAGQAITGNAMFSEEFRIVRPDGGIRWLSNLGHIEYNQSGKSVRMIGAVQDITQRKQIEIERQALLEIMQGLADTADLHDFLALIHRSIGNVIYAENFFVVFHNQETGLFEEIYSVDQYDPPAPPDRLEKSITSYVFRTGEPILMDQELFEQLAARGEVELIGTNSASWLGAPLKTSNGTIGVIVVQDYENRNRYTERDKHFLASIAAQAALALERRQAEEMVRGSEERYRALFESSPISIWEQDFSQVKKYLDSLKQQGVTNFASFFAEHPEVLMKCTQMIEVLDVNRAGLQMYHASSKKELIESTIQATCKGEQDHNPEDFIAIAEGRISNGWEGNDESLTGEPLEINLRWSVAPGYEQDYSRVIVTVIDITERRRAEEEIDRRAKETSALLETSLALTNLDLQAILQEVGNSAKDLFAADGCRIFLTQPDGELLRCVLALQESPTAFMHLVIKPGEGVTGSVAASGQAEIVNQMRNDPRAVQVPGTVEEDEALMFAPLKERDRTIGVLSIRRVGIDRPFQPADLEFLEAFASMAASAVSNARLYQAAQQEITERKLVEEELRESQERYRLLIETSPDGIIMMNMDGAIRFSNQQMAGLFNFETPAELFGLDFISLFAPEERALLEQRTAAYLLEGKAQEGHWFIRKDGSSFFAELHSSGLRNDKGEQYAIIAQLRDVTERKQSQEALREERQRFLDLFENSPIPTWLEDFTGVAAWMDELKAKGVTDLKQFLQENPDEYMVGVSLIRVLDINNAAVIMNGAHNTQELLHILQELMLDNTPSPILIHEFDMIWQGNISFDFEMTSSKLDGSLITGILHIYIPADNGQPDYTRVIVTSTDITERVEIERRLRASELHYRELADSISDVLFELDRNLRYTHWNKASEILMGIPANGAIGKSMYEIFGESEEQNRIGRIYRGVLQEGQSITFETEIPIGGQKLVFEINANPSMHGVSVVARNITERKLSETLMQKRFELVEFSAHHSFQEVLQKTIDVASELTGSHAGFLHFIEDDQTTIKLQSWSTETIREFCQAECEDLHYPLEQAGVWADAVRHRRSIIHNDYASLPGRKGTPEGHARVDREMVIPIIRNEKIMAVIGVGNKDQEYTHQDIEIAGRFADYAWDITERKQMESVLAEERNQLAKRVEERTADLSRANSNLARALRVKDEFLANMSHELRTPLNAILGLSESLGEQVAGPLNEKQQKYLSTINESGHHLLALINDILDLAKIEAGQITLDINKVDVNSVCQASLRMIKQLAQKKSQEVIFEIDSDLGLMWADERRLKQMIVNLLSNAVKFTPEYSKIGLEVHGNRAANRVTITVWDTGIGVKDDDLQRLFKPFVQLDSGLAREATGTGLGLALVAQMARLHGGSVHALSKPGEGSRFIIQLPWEPAMATEMAAHLRNTGKFRAIDPNAHRPTILLIEDTREVVMILVDYLEMAGYEMVTAQDGVDGLEQAKLTHPDLILMDIQMPRMDGFEATQKLRNEPEFRDIPIIALTALAMPNDRQRCLDAGMDEYISKPVNLKALTKTIHKLLSPEAGVS